jgi:hypothetical protein
VPGLFRQAEHHLGVDEVLGTTRARQSQSSQCPKGTGDGASVGREWSRGHARDHTAS